MGQLTTAWASLPAAAQDALVLVALLVPPAAVGAIVTRGFRTGAITRALLWRFRGTNLVFVALIGLSVGLGIALVAQERALRQGTARAAQKFDLIVAAPGDRIRMLLAAVYLQPSDAPLLGGDVLAELQADPRIDLLAPIAFGDSFEGAPVVGTIAAFAAHLAGPLAVGRMFATHDEAVAGALAPVALGATFTPLHGHGDFAEDVHGGVPVAVVGRMAPTGSPWDHAILVPVESVWETHGLASGHAPRERRPARAAVRPGPLPRLACLPRACRRARGPLRPARRLRHRPHDGVLPRRRAGASSTPCWATSARRCR